MGIYRNYLWEGGEGYHKAPSVSWESVYLGKANGGLGIIHSQVWNTAMIGKYAWWVATKADHLWIRWVNQIYIKQRDWADFQPSVSSSWNWCQICKVKEQMKMGFVNGVWAPNNGKYSATLGYAWLMGHQAKVNWYPMVWNRIALPKHNFIAWLYAWGRLLTKDRMMQYGISLDGTCDLCGLFNESRDHLFFDCVFSEECLQLLGRWLGYVIPVHGTLEWCRSLRMKSLMKKHIIIAAGGLGCKSSLDGFNSGSAGDQNFRQEDAGVLYTKGRCSLVYPVRFDVTIDRPCSLELLSLNVLE
ncbi:uncharacterized protein LOC141627718 [Silene latifolia]|uniref:uncharacterized protein LOC141627718 n=1 Tax=Silene latifolia TaxID=37657 RepID=UPI003D7855E6